MKLASASVCLLLIPVLLSGCGEPAEICKKYTTTTTIVPNGRGGITVIPQAVCIDWQPNPKYRKKD